MEMKLRHLNDGHIKRGIPCIFKWAIFRFPTETWFPCNVGGDG
jgi:hypothetical protein